MTVYHCDKALNLRLGARKFWKKTVGAGMHGASVKGMTSFINFFYVFSQSIVVPRAAARMRYVEFVHMIALSSETLEIRVTITLVSQEKCSSTVVKLMYLCAHV